MSEITRDELLQENKNLQQKVDNLFDTRKRLIDQVEYTYAPCFNKITGYVQKHGAKWDVKYLGRICHDVIVDRCETLQEENQRLQSIIDKQRDTLNRINALADRHSKDGGTVRDLQLALLVIGDTAGAQQQSTGEVTK